MKTEIAIIKDRKVFRIEAPPGTRVLNGDRAMDVEFDIASVNDEMFLAKHIRHTCSAWPSRLVLQHIRWCWLPYRSEEHTSELQSHSHLVCRLLLGKEEH